MTRIRFTFSWRRVGGFIPMLALFAGAPAGAASDGPWTVSVQVGQASVDGAFGPAEPVWRVDDEATAGGVEVGYLFHPHLELRVGYRDLGEFRARNLPCPPDHFCLLDAEQSFVDPDAVLAPLDAEFDGFTLVAVPRWPLSERMALYGKLGVIDWDGEIAFDESVGGGVLDRPSGQDLLGGLGAVYTFPRGFGMHVEVETNDLFDQASLGSSWRF